MLRCNEVRPAGSWDRSHPADTVTLDYDGRHRRRHAMRGEGGLAFLLDLSETTALRDGDGLVLSDGRLVLVKADPERLMEISGPDTAALIRIAWHLGNRHLPTQLVQDRLRIRHDHVIRDMVAGLGGTVTNMEASFDPEGGAFAHGLAHDHPTLEDHSLKQANVDHEHSHSG